MRQVRTVVSNAFGGGIAGAKVVVSGFYLEAPKGCSNTKLAAKEKAVAGHEEDGDADMLVDDEAVEGVPPRSHNWTDAKRVNKCAQPLPVIKGI